eukprot:scaffold2908_cov257-Pinguiococcus_pyrenoidosus.AAC.16
MAPCYPLRDPMEHQYQRKGVRKGPREVEKQVELRDAQAEEPGADARSDVLLRRGRHPTQRPDP